LATVAPAAAATNIDAVEMLKVCAPSPPVPTMSTKCGSAVDIDLGRQLAHDLRGGGDLADGLLLDAQAGEDGGGHHRRHLAAHDLRISESISSWKISRCSMCGQGFLRGDGHVRLQEILQQRVAVLGQDGFGVELHAFDVAASRWRTPMISPSSVQAVTSRQSGSVSRSIASEW
jgi:hypothetical protein